MVYKTCSDCDSRLTSYDACNWCDEETIIVMDQYEDIGEISDEWRNKLKEQKNRIKNRKLSY